MGFFQILREVLAIAEQLGKSVAPGEVSAADTAIKDILQFVVKVAHPNTWAFRAATAALAVLP